MSACERVWGNLQPCVSVNVCVREDGNVCTHACSDRYELERRFSNVCDWSVCMLVCVRAPLTFTLFTYLPCSCVVKCEPASACVHPDVHLSILSHHPHPLLP